MSLRWRLAAGIMLAFSVTLAVIFVTVQFALQRILTNDLDSELSGDATRVLAQVLVAGDINDPRLVSDILANASSREGHTPFITVIRNADGTAVRWTLGVQEQNLALTPDELTRVLSGDELKWTIDLPGDKEYRVRTQALRQGDSSEPVGIVQVARVTESVTDPVNTLLVILIGEGIVATALAVIAGIWLSRGALKPLQKVVDVAAEIQASDLTRRIGASREPAEVQKLADTFDAMLERLDHAFQEQRNFVMDVSHELRTPLTVLKGNIDVMLMDPQLDAVSREQYERMSGEVARLIRLTTNLLYMASADAGREPERRPVELDLLCMEVIRQSKDLRHDVKVALGREDQITILGDRDQLKQMVLNLVENAIKYTKSGSEVTVSLQRNGTRAEMRVSDVGPGIPPDVVPHIFQRFYRGNQRGLMGGTGLGLAIADRIARAHGGEIRVESEVGKGSVFAVQLPMAHDGEDGQSV